MECVANKWYQYPSYWRWDQQLKITSLDMRGNILNIIHKQNKIKQCYFEQNHQLYIDTMTGNDEIPSGMFRGYEILTNDVKNYKDIFIYNTGVSNENMMIHVYDCNNETDYECNKLDYVRFMKYDTDSKDNLSKRYNIDFTAVIAES